MSTAISKDLLLSAGYILTSRNTVRSPGLYLVGKFSLGDADGEKNSDLEIESLDELTAINKYLSWKNKMGWNEEINYRQRSGYQKMEDDFYAQAGKEWEEHYLWDNVLDWWANDEIAGGILARLERTTLIYSDGGHEWEVTI